MKEPSELLRRKIGANVASIVDANRPCSNTGFDAPLAVVVLAGLEEEARLLLAKGADPNAGMTPPFVAACIGGHVEVAELLRLAGAQVFVTVEERPRGHVLQALDDAAARQMRAHGIEPKPPGYRYCPALFSVATRGAPGVARYLVGLGSELRQRDMNDESLLHKAAAGGNVGMIRYLIGEGLEVDRPKGRHAETPLHYAVRYNQLDAARLLLERGADPSPVDRFEGAEHKWAETPLDIVRGPRMRKLLKEHGAKSGKELVGH